MSGKRVVLKTAVCPGCGTKGLLRRIIYGMPDPETFNFEKYAVGGCCIRGDGLDPQFACRECDWEGFKEDLLVK
ncbi:MAG: hypothetical protein FGM60_06805 [Candidatus Planktophila sp.]|nr:hypothetical protein [Candidatus Planktophila sp.]